MSANDTQVGGDHYKSSIQHWDYVVANDLDYFQAQITKYVTRWKKKNGVKDLEKAQHFLQKYLELERKKLLENATKLKVEDRLASFPRTDLGEGVNYFGAGVAQKANYTHGYDPGKENGGK